MKMKTILVLMLGTFFSLNALAMGKGMVSPTASDSWDTIRKDVAADPSLSIGQPSYSTAFGGDGLFNACFDGTNLRAIKPLSECVEGHWIHTEHGQQDDEYVCDKYSAKPVVIPTTMTEEKCVESHWVGSGHGQQDGEDVCDKWETVTTTIPLNPELSLWKTHGVGHGQQDSEDVLLFNKNYQIPNCN